MIRVKKFFPLKKTTLENHGYFLFFTLKKSFTLKQVRSRFKNQHIKTFFNVLETSVCDFRVSEKCQGTKWLHIYYKVAGKFDHVCPNLSK